MNRVLIIAFLLVACVAAFFGVQYFLEDKRPTYTLPPGPSVFGDYQAVFLDNGQVYFGRLDGTDARFLELHDVYYLQVNQVLQPAPEGDAPTPSTDVSLVRLGGELHGPENAMRINRDHVLLIEDLRPDSNVVTAIREHQETPAAQ